MTAGHHHEAERPAEPALSWLILGELIADGVRVAAEGSAWKAFMSRGSYMSI